MSKDIRLSMQKVIGKGYADYWNFKGRYRICKGSRASKKSKTTAIYYIKNLMKYPQANLLIIRKTYRTLKDSCFAELKWAIHQLQVDDEWAIKESPLEMTYKPTGQKIYFRGLDDPLKVTSITVDKGVLCWMWIEEAYEVLNEDDFNMLDESIRGAAPEGLFKQITLTLNPWNERHWIKRRFFDAENDPDILAKTTNYLCNEFLDDADKRVFDRMKRDNPRRYQVAGLGNWGIVDGLVFENWEERNFDIKKLLQERKRMKTFFGLDFGYTNDPTAFFAGAVDEEVKEIYVFDELYKHALTNRMIYEEVSQLGYAKERIRADSAEPKSIDDLYELGLKSIMKARKGKDSINNGIQTIQDYKIIIHPSCVNFLTEITNYTWDEDKFGKKLNRPIDDFNHLMDAMRYALEDLKGDLFSFD
ncbi:pbsx family phage terminase large subunit [Bacillus sp. OxB-1]|uniref:PBSX family phage terminase large subunit n=1 Tax=Bacillus sp. (strain OxB-1) TaxID=98228 RepID=UPI0005822EB3|nr:PBSX family phage terminase large subunit [Bacillus sp. OxB-1]BAQ11318.1 pbsx family phage terminase large subunit [Bacillus sp. OxB-1]